VRPYWHRNADNCYLAPARRIARVDPTKEESSMNKVTGFLIASAAAGLVLSGAVGAIAADEKTGGDVYCSGINSCKGAGACAGAGHGCAGKNGCKGQGVVKSTEKECKDKGGKVVPDPHGK
jgi:hypothetical protein